MKKAAPDNRTDRSRLVINIISVAVPLLVIILLAFPNKLEFGNWTKVLPHVIGTVNSLTSLLLILGFVFIRSGNVRLHRYSMTSAILLGVVFLICYVTYHISNPSNKFSGEGAIKIVYLLILLSHIVFSLVVLPLVLRAFSYAITGRVENHKRVAKFALPIWLYVSITGVIVYLMLYHLFPSG